MRLEALPVFVKCNRRKSIGQKIKPFFLKAHSTVPSLARRKQSRQVEIKPTDPLAFV